MKPGKSELICISCGRCLQEYVCVNCRLVHCPFCGASEKQGCSHLLADWSGIGGRASKFHHSPMLNGTPPFLTLDDGSLMTLPPGEAEKVLGELSPLLLAYGGNVFEPPNPVVLFQSIVNVIPEPGIRVSRCEPGMSGMGGHVFWFASNVTAARAELTSILFRVFDRFTELGHHLVPKPEEQSSTVPEDPTLEQVVYGNWGDSLVFAKRSDADQLCACQIALHTARTWGEFGSLVGPEAYEQVIEFMGYDYEETITDFTAFYEELIHRKPDTTPEQAREEYLKLPVGDRYPEDKDPFSSDQVPGIDDHDWPAWPAQQMLDWVPKEIQEKYGSMESCLNGEYLTLNPRNESKITAAFRRAGYRCTRDDKLIQRASGIKV